MNQRKLYYFQIAQPGKDWDATPVFGVLLLFPDMVKSFATNLANLARLEVRLSDNEKLVSGRYFRPTTLLTVGAEMAEISDYVQSNTSETENSNFPGPTNL